MRKRQHSELSEKTSIYQKQFLFLFFMRSGIRQFKRSVRLLWGPFIFPFGAPINLVPRAFHYRVGGSWERGWSRIQCLVCLHTIYWGLKTKDISLFIKSLIKHSKSQLFSKKLSNYNTKRYLGTPVVLFVDFYSINLWNHQWFLPHIIWACF